MEVFNSLTHDSLLLLFHRQLLKTNDGKRDLCTFQQQGGPGLQGCKDAGCVLQEGCGVCMLQAIPQHLVCKGLVCLLLQGSNNSCVCQLHIPSWGHVDWCVNACLVLLLGLLEEPVSSCMSEGAGMCEVSRATTLWSSSICKVAVGQHWLTVQPSSYLLLSQRCRSTMPEADR